MHRGFLVLVAAGVWSWTGAAAAETHREGDVWILENPSILVRVDPQEGRIEVREKGSGRQWRQPTPEEGARAAGLPPRLRSAHVLASPADGVAFETDFGQSGGIPHLMTVAFSIPVEGADLAIEADMPDREAQIANRPFMDLFILDAPRAVLAISYQSNGHLYPLATSPFPVVALETCRLDMPWFGVCDLDGGAGYLVFLETSDDAVVRCDPFHISGRILHVPRLLWSPTKGIFGYPRRLVCRFFAQGGYVAMAKAYRARAKEQGLLVTLAEKAQRNPNVERLFGAVDVWGADLDLAQEAKAAGVTKMLFHGRPSPQEIQIVNGLGYLTSTYDNYSDILPLEAGKRVDANHDLVPDHAALRADGQRMTAHFDWKTKTQYMKRCPRFWEGAAEAVIPQVLETHPYFGRFIDVITAESPFECFAPEHPVARSDYRELGKDLLGYVESRNLVVGGEMGVWWAVPHTAYIEGMMSGGYRYYAWPAGQLVRPQTKSQEFTSPRGEKLLATWADYETWGIGHEHRAPLWELVFHDCVVSTWYWGDSNDWLLQAAPEVTAKKDAFNVLYGTMPLLWGGRPESSWRAARDVFLHTCRSVCRLHEAVAGTEMLSHEFLTADRAVQRTRFSNGVEVIVNFGEAPYEASVAGAKHVLPQNGFAAQGPAFGQFLELVDGNVVMTGP